jgi:hypothetical protein
MANQAKLQIVIEALNKSQAETKQLLADLKSIEAESGKVSTSFDKLESTGGKMSSVGNKLSLGVTLPLTGIAVAATKAASDLGETMNKIDVLFGSSSNKIKDWSTTTAASLGQSRTAALNGAADFAVFGKSAGLAGDDLVKFSKQNVQLASDMASFFNTSPEEAVTAIGAAFRGEAEPIRKYGVLINDVSLKQEAMALGIIKTTSEALTPQQRVLAAQALIMAQTSAAQGDFARTSDGLANSTRIMKAQFEDSLATLGERFLPLAQQGVNIVTGLVTAFNGLPAPMQNAIVAFGAIAAAAGPVLKIGGEITQVVGKIGPSMIESGGGLLNMMKSVGEAAGFLKSAGTSADSLRFAFQYLKSSGALLTGELGLIVAGLVVIVTYLQRVGQAAGATNDKLIEMSHSGDLFDQAAASTEIMINGQNRLRTTMDQVHEEIKKNSTGYSEYRSAIDGVAKAAGYEINAAGDLVQVWNGMAGRQERVVQANYAMADSQYNAAQMVREFGKAANDVGTAWGNAGGAAGKSSASFLTATESIRANNSEIGRLQGVLTDLSERGFEPQSVQIQRVRDEIDRLTQANQGLEGSLRNVQTALPDTLAAFKDKSIADAAQSIEILKIAMEGAVGNEMQSFGAKQDELNAKAAELQGVISTSYGKARDDAVASLGEINKELGANAAAHAEATKRILFDISAQQLATIQDPVLRANAMNTLALQWGLVDKATYDATTKIIGYTDQLANDKNLAMFKANMSGLASDVLGVPKVIAQSVDEARTEAGKMAGNPVKIPIGVSVEDAKVAVTEAHQRMQDEALGKEVVIPLKVTTVTTGGGAAERDQQVTAREAAAASETVATQAAAVKGTVQTSLVDINKMSADSAKVIGDSATKAITGWGDVAKTTISGVKGYVDDALVSYQQLANPIAMSLDNSTALNSIQQLLDKAEQLRDILAGGAGAAPAAAPSSGTRMPDVTEKMRSRGIVT